MLPVWSGGSSAMKIFASRLKELHKMVKTNLEEAHARYKKYANVKRKEQPKL